MTPLLEQMLDPSNYTFSGWAVPLLIVGCVNIGFGLCVTIHERGSAESLALQLLGLSAGFWLMSFGAIYSTNNPTVALGWVRIEHIGLVLMPTANYVSASAITGRLRRNDPLLWSSVILGAVVYAITVSTDWMVRDLHHYFWGYYPLYGWAVPLLLIDFVVFLGLSLHMYRISYETTQSSAQRRRMKVLLIAMIIGNIATVDFLPAFGVPIYPFGYVFIGGYLIVAGRMIWRDRLVDITPALAARQIVDTMAEGLLVLDLDGVIRIANEASVQMLGLSQRHLIGATCADLDASSFDGALNQIVDAEEGHQREIVYRRSDGAGGTAIVSSTRLYHSTGEWIGTVCVIHDITHRKLAEETLRESEALYRTLVETSPDAVILAEQNGRILMVNGRAAELFGIDRAEDLRGLSAVEFLAPEDRTQLAESFRNADGSAVVRDLECTVVKRDGSTLAAELSVSRVPDARGAMTAVVAVVRDITTRKRAEEEIRYLAFHDVLTGTANRSVLIDRANQALARARRDGTGVGLIFVDLDGFKEINDTQGHDAGDTVLKATAEALRHQLRDGDTLARVGGDEFVVLLPGLGDPVETALVAKRILRRLDETTSIHASLGIAAFPVDGADAESLLVRADAAMYVAKKRGGNDYQLYEPKPSAATQPTQIAPQRRAS